MVRIAVLLCSRIVEWFSYPYATLNLPMRQFPFVFLCLGAFACFGQAPPGSPEALANKRIELANRDLQRVTELVQADALPRIRLEQAKLDVADAEDDAILARNLFGDWTANDLNDQLSDEMVAAAQRRVDRQQARIDQARMLVDKGFAAVTSVAPLFQELSTRQSTLNLAHARASLLSRQTELAKLESAIAAIRNPTSGGNHDAFETFDQSMEHYEGAGKFNEARDLKPLELAFARKFDHPLPISADGETNLHRALGFDHRGRVDVAINPMDPEGVWLRQYLHSRQIPYYAFTHAVPGKATAAHIHIGPGSTRLAAGD
jgi:hypothetical protein